MVISLNKERIQAEWQVVKFGEIDREFRLTTQASIKDELEFFVGSEHLDQQAYTRFPPWPIWLLSFVNQQKKLER